MSRYRNRGWRRTPWRDETFVPPGEPAPGEEPVGAVWAEYLRRNPALGASAPDVVRGRRVLEFGRLTPSPNPSSSTSSPLPSSPQSPTPPSLPSSSTSHTPLPPQTLTAVADALAALSPSGSLPTPQPSFTIPSHSPTLPSYSQALRSLPPPILSPTPSQQSRQSSRSLQELMALKPRPPLPSPAPVLPPYPQRPVTPFTPTSTHHIPPLMSCTIVPPSSIPALMSLQIPVPSSLIPAATPRAAASVVAPRFFGQCWNCGEEGHSRTRCPNPRPWRTCWRCGASGWMGGRCPVARCGAPWRESP